MLRFTTRPDFNLGVSLDIIPNSTKWFQMAVHRLILDRSSRKISVCRFEFEHMTFWFEEKRVFRREQVEVW